jgi:hypothetical protein
MELISFQTHHFVADISIHVRARITHGFRLKIWKNLAFPVERSQVTFSNQWLATRPTSEQGSAAGPNKSADWLRGPPSFETDQAAPWHAALDVMMKNIAAGAATWNRKEKRGTADSTE